MKHTRVLVGALTALCMAEANAGEAVFVVTDAGIAAGGVTVIIDGQKQQVQGNGLAVFDMADGEHTVELSRSDRVIKTFKLVLKNGQDAEIKVDVEGGAPDITLYGAGEGAANGTIAGVLADADTAEAIVGARISVSGTDIAAMTDENGGFVLDVPRGKWDVTVRHPVYGEHASRGIRVVSGAAAALNMELRPASSGIVEELVATGTYVAGPGIEQKRDASSIIESIGNEQFSKMGDSDAASALKRVSGVSLIGGQYAVVRGLTGRYISSSLNGGAIPSTNPLSRDVQLDLFPASMLQGIEIKKSFTPELPGDSTGGAINMITKGLPDERITRFTGGLGVRSGVTQQDVISYDGGDRDVLGYDDGTREMPSIVNGTTFFGQNAFNVCLDPSICLTPQDAATLGTAFENNYNPSDRTATPDIDAGIAHGDRTEVKGGSIGYYGDLSYKNKWTARQDAEIHDDSGDYDYERSRQLVDVNAYGVVGFENDEGTLEVLSKTTLLRKSDDTTRQQVGTDNEGTEITDVTLQWAERSYLGQSFTGKHLFSDDVHQVDWRTTVAESTVSEPDRRTYQFRGGKIFPSTLERRFTEQTDDSLDLGVDYTFNAELSADVSSKLKAGAYMADKDRETWLGRFGFNQGPNAPTDGDLESLLSPANINAGQYTLAVRTAQTDSYEAEDTMDAYYVSSETDIRGEYTVVAGVRIEDAKQTLEYQGAPANNDTYDTSETLPALSATWKYDDQWQFRGGYSQTVSRPGLTERSRSSQYDPETDEQVFGNPDLVISNIDNVDVRAEYYFDEVDNISVGIFRKDIDNPIERTVPDASGSSANGYTFVNQDRATVSGIELDGQKLVMTTSEFEGTVGGNLSFIDSEVTLAGRSIVLEGGDSTRELQGQSDTLANVQFGVEHVPSAQSLNMMVNYFSDRIAKVGRAGRNEEESGRAVVDLVYKYEVDDALTVGAKVQNLFDQKVQYTIFDDTSETWKDGTYLNVNATWNL